MKIGDKAKVVDKKSLLYNKTVELIKVCNEAYIFYFEPQKLKLAVHKDAIQRTIEWESSPDRAETNFDKLLGQNGELVEERKKQVLAGALGIVQHHYKETPNKMEAVARLFSKQLSESFWIESSVHKVAKKVRFTENGMEYFDDSCGRWYPTEAFMREILTGQAVIVNENRR